jgi:hypothetical protein
MSMVRCAQCHASLPIPEALEARTMQCHYCGAIQGVPDLAARERALAERQRAEAHARHVEQEARHREQEAQRQARREAEERQERRSGVRWGRVTTIFSMLLAPAIIGVTVFDLPARLGFGPDGKDRLAIVATQLAERGCTPLAPVAAQYTSTTITGLVKPEGRCLRVVAAGGPDQDSLKVRIFDLDGEEVAASKESSDPQAEHCPPTSGSLRYEVVPGMMDKGRLSHLAVACPPPPAQRSGGKDAAEAAPAVEPKKKPRR